jgi:molecular chaperone Hsp31 and glyoxalase 3
MSNDRAPAADRAEDNAWFPSPYSLTQYVGPKSDFGGADYPNAYTGGKWKILLIGTQERYLKMADGRFFSTGNHPLELLLPLKHLAAAGFDIDIATISGDPVKFEQWAFPTEDEQVKAIYNDFKEKFRSPLSLQDVWGDGFTSETPYLGIFVPGGHGAMNGIPHSATVGKILRWAHKNNRYLISLCHGPACLLAANVAKPEGEKFIYEGYEVDVFPDSLDNGANIDIGYIPGKLPWLVAEELRKLGVKIVNKEMSGATHQDRYVKPLILPL